MDPQRKRRRRAKTAFAKWYEAQTIDAIGLAMRLGVSASYVYGLLNGTSTPGAKMRLKIQGYTGGAVPFDAWK